MKPASHVVSSALPYLAVNAAFSIALSARSGWKHLPLLAWTFSILHLAYGTGFLVGVGNFLLLRRKG